MKVLKFGGTSVGSVNSMLSVKRIVEGVDDKVIVVVSALGGITDKLICTSKMAASGDDSYEKEMKEIVNRHIEMVYTVIPAGRGRELLLDLVNELLSELKDIFQGIYLIRDLSPKTSATIVSYGERLSSIIVATLIQGAVWFDSRTFIKTEKNITSIFWIRNLPISWYVRHSAKFQTYPSCRDLFRPTRIPVRSPTWDGVVRIIRLLSLRQHWMRTFWKFGRMWMAL